MTVLFIAFVFICSIMLQAQEGEAADISLENLIEDGAAPQLLADGFRFTEGPAADVDGNIYFTDIGNNRIHYWDASSEKLSTIRENSNGADGLFVDREGALLICEMSGKRLSKLYKDGTYKVLFDSYEGNGLTGPNDLWIDHYGGIYFSDSYGGSQKRTHDHRIFYLSREGELRLLANDFFKSNGLMGTRNGKWLYVSDDIDNKVYRYEVSEPGVLGERSVFAEYRTDGMTMDEGGNVYLCTGNAGFGVVVFNPQGEELGKIRLPENPANICFGGSDRKTLYITATHGLYSLDMKVNGNAGNSPQEPVIVDEGGVGELIAIGAEPEMLATGFQIAQGPAANANGDFYFSDIFHHRIMKWEFEEGRLFKVREQTGGPDGLFVEADGSLLVCELFGRRFARLRPEGNYEIIATEYRDKALTGPNDVFVDNQGGIYFSDSYTGANIRDPEYCVYYIAPGSNKLKQIVNDHYKTKGLHISCDGKWIYMADYGGRKVFRYALLSPGVLGRKELFIDTRCGGMTVDKRGNVYISTVGDYKGVLVYDSEGKRLGQIIIPEATTSVAFAGPHRDKLIITTFKSIYSLEMNVSGMELR